MRRGARTSVAALRAAILERAPVGGRGPFEVKPATPLLPASPAGRSGPGLAYRLGLFAVVAVTLLGALLAVAQAPASAGGPTFTFNGGGYGHGLGMSQYGALGMANAGTPYDGILAHYYTGIGIQSLSQPAPQVYVGSATSTTVEATSGDLIIEVADPAYGGYAPITAVHPGSTATIVDSGTDAGNGRYGIYLDGVPLGAYGTANGFAFVRMNQNPARVGVTNQRYKWGNIVLADSGGVLDVIVQDMTMEQYLYGLGEAPSSWPIAALQAQAVTGRTYAKEAVERRRDCRARSPQCWTERWDLAGSTSDQAYVGFEKEAGSFGSSWVAAVNSTASVTATYGGNAISAFYSSSSGGYTDNSEYVFYAALPYIRGVSDPYDAVSANPSYRWSKSFDGDQLGALIGGVGQVSSISISGPRGVSGRIDRAQVTVTGSAGTKTISGQQLQRRLGLRSTLVLSIAGGSNTLPIGAYEAAVAGPSTVSVQGWAIDPDVNAATEIDVWADGSFLGYGSASQYRADVAAAYPSYGGNHGYSFSMPIAPGAHSVCVYAIDINQPSTNRALGCRNVTVAAPSDRAPFGNVEASVRVPGGLSVQGWALDPDTSGPIEVDAYVDGRFAGYGSADRPRPDIGQAYPGYGPNHGFDVSVAVPAGTHSLCLYAINYGGSVNPSLGCRNVTVDAQPFGNLDALYRSGSTAVVQGWAIDPDVASGIEIDVLVDGVLGGYGAADRPRPDVGEVFPRYGPNHGFAFSLPLGPAPRTVCVYAINVAAGNNVSLGCGSI